MTGFNVMLAKSAPCTPETIDMLSGTHYFDLKIDGVRDVIALNRGRVTITNRNGITTTERYPDIVAGVIRQFGNDTTLILDGEMVVKENGRPSFPLTAKRDKQQKPAAIRNMSASHPATFIAFDILYADGADMRGLPLTQRLVALGERLRGRTGPVEANVGSLDGHKMLDLVRKHGLEGLIAKRLNSTYQAGKRSDWLKIKPTFMLSAVVTGFSAGTGARASTFGALSLALYKDGVLTDIGEVGTGFKNNDLLEIQADLAAGKTLVVDVEYQEFTELGSLRFPVYRGIRSDVSPDECLFSQTDPIAVLEEA